MSTNQTRTFPLSAIVLLAVANLIVMLSYAAQSVLLRRSAQGEAQAIQGLQTAQADLEQLSRREQDLERRAAALAVSCWGSRNTVDWR